MTEPTASVPDGELSPEDQEAGDSPALNKDESLAVADDSSYHLLEGRWTFWYTHRPTTLRNSSINYDSCLKKLGSSLRPSSILEKAFSVRLGSFGSIEEFWCYYDHMKFPSELPFYRFVRR